MQWHSGTYDRHLSACKDVFHLHVLLPEGEEVADEQAEYFLVCCFSKGQFG